MEDLCCLILRHYKSHSNKKVWYWHKSRQKLVKQKSSETDLYVHGQFIFDESAKSINEQRKSFEQMLLQQLDIHMEKTKP